MSRACREDPWNPTERLDESHKSFVGAPDGGNGKTRSLRSGKPEAGPSPPDFTTTSRSPILEETLD